MGLTLGKQNKDVLHAALGRSDELISEIKKYLNDENWSSEVAEIEARLERLMNRVSGLDTIVKKTSISISKSIEDIRGLCEILDSISKAYKEDDYMVRKSGEGREVIEKVITQLEQTVIELRVSIPSSEPHTPEESVSPPHINIDRLSPIFLPKKRRRKMSIMKAD